MTAGKPAPLSRRSLLWASSLGLLAGCSTAGTTAPGRTVVPSAAPTSRPRPGGDPTPEPTTPTRPAPPPPVDVPPYAVLPGEVEPACKVAAVRALEAALTWRDGPVGPDAARERVQGLGVHEGALRPLARLLDTTPWSSLKVTYPQYGGLVPEPGEASVMVVCEQLVPDDAAPAERSVTVDARLVRRNGTWEVTELLLSEPPAPAPQITDAARAVLANDRIVLPAAARRDVQAGLIDDLVLTMLSGLAQQWRLDVLVLSTGHPFNVFGTDRQSNHTRGRAVDIWALDGIPVIDQARAPWRAAMEAAAALGATEIGGPQDVDGVRGRRPYFSDLVHQDQLHLGFEVTR
ncbi:hypothetical protein HJG43_06805 [Kineosporiaceae bacterium SCSIO 59966]|nr:hypothetical protein HJG43_06805 [Kineosporiaceae bacterium SCSIO 59966]